MDNLCKAIISALAFLELSGDEIVDPDSAVAASEAIAAELQSSSLAEKAAFIRICEQEASKLRSGIMDERMAEFVAALPRNIGLVGDEA